MYRRSSGKTLLRTLIVFCFGAVSMLVFLTPSNVDFVERFKVLTDEDKREEIVDFEHAADKIEDTSESVRKAVNRFCAEKFVRRD